MGKSKSQGDLQHGRHHPAPPKSCPGKMHDKDHWRQKGRAENKLALQKLLLLGRGGGTNWRSGSPAPHMIICGGGGSQSRPEALKVGIRAERKLSGSVQQREGSR